MTVNYRLGPWGELSLDSGRISGNQGLRDQVQGDKGPLTRYQVQGLWDNVQGLRDQLHKMHFFFFFNLSLRFLPCSGFRRTLFIWEATLRRSLFGERVLEHGGLFYLFFSFIITLVIIIGIVIIIIPIIIVVIVILISRSVFHHLLAPQSNGLFRAGLANSGTMISGLADRWLRRHRHRHQHRRRQCHHRHRPRRHHRCHRHHLLYQVNDT